MITVRAVGRGMNYSLKRAVLEKIARVVYAGGWPARAWARVPGRTNVDLIEHSLPLLPPPPSKPTSTSTSRSSALRVAFASDFHIGPLTSSLLLDRAFALLAQVKPDVLVLGGDYVYLEATPHMAEELERRVAAVPAPVKLAVMGNHDLWTRHDLIERALERAGATVLVNQSVRLPAPFDDVVFAGLDEPWTGQPDPERMLAGTDGAGLKIGIAHSPEAVPMLVGRGLGLLLCGHTHGGQIALPSGPVVVHGRHGRRFPAGLFQVDDLQLFVSRGLGAVELPFRVYARPDVSLFRIVPVGSVAGGGRPGSAIGV